MWKNEKFTDKNILWNQLFSNFFCKNVAFTKFMSKKFKSKFPYFAHCEMGDKKLIVKNDLLKQKYLRSKKYANSISGFRGPRPFFTKKWLELQKYFNWDHWFIDFYNDSIDVDSYLYLCIWKPNYLFRCGRT